MKEVDPLKHFGTFPTIAQADVCQRGTQTLTPRTWNIHGLKIFNDTCILKYVICAKVTFISWIDSKEKWSKHALQTHLQP